MSGIIQNSAASRLVAADDIANPPVEGSIRYFRHSTINNGHSIRLEVADTDTSYMTGDDANNYQRLQIKLRYPPDHANAGQLVTSWIFIGELDMEACDKICDVA